jgi:hypothetical protein
MFLKNIKLKVKSLNYFHECRLFSLQMGSSNYLPLFMLNGLASQTVSLKSEKFEMDLGHLAPASEVAEGITLPFKKRHGLQILKWYG